MAYHLINKINIYLSFIFLIIFLFTTNISARANNVVSFNFSSLRNNISSGICGLNLKGGMANFNLSSQQYEDKLLSIRPNTVRFHDSIGDNGYANWKGWIDPWAKDWIRWKIQDWAKEVRDFQAKGYSPKIILTVDRYFSWMKLKPVLNSQGQIISYILDESEYNNFANMVERLLQIVIVEEKINLDYLQILNEADYQYHVNVVNRGGVSQVNKLMDLIINTAKRVKAKYPTLKLMTPSTARTDLTAQFDTMFSRMRSDSVGLFQAVGFNYYLTGNSSEPLNNVYNLAQSALLWHFNSVQSRLNRFGLNGLKAIPTEFNINWNEIDMRMQQMPGAIVDALTYMEGAKLGVESVIPWTDMGTYFGKWNNNYVDSFAMRVQNICGKYIRSSRLVTQLNTLSNVEFLPMIRSNGKKAILIVNKNLVSQNVSLAGFSLTGTSFIWNQLSGTNKIRTYSLPNSLVSNLGLPAQSISVLEER
jgi:hypothetical protein